MPENALNGGFPEPPASSPVRVVAAHHDACGADTRVRLPGTVPARAVRRFHCAGCAAAFTTRHVEEIELRLAEGTLAPAVPAPAPPATPAPSAPAKSPRRAKAPGKAKAPKRARAPKPAKPPRAKRSLPRLDGAKRSMSKLAKTQIAMPKLAKPKLAKPKPPLPKPAKAAAADGPVAAKARRSFDPDSSGWKILSIGVAGFAVIAILLAVRGGGEDPSPSAVPAAAVAAAPAADSGNSKQGKADKQTAKPAKDTKFVSESSFSLALPAGWQRVDPPAGATFSAVEAGGAADATLWIKEDPKLDFPTFVSQSLAQLKTLAGSAQVVERIPAPTAEGTVVRLAADAPAGQPTYEVTLRVAGPYRYYLATTVQPDASTDVVDGVDLITGSFTPELGG